VIHHLLGEIPYEDLTPPPLELPERQPPGDYVPPDWSELEIPDVYR
jgi:hypothetical protein